MRPLRALRLTRGTRRRDHRCVLDRASHTASKIVSRLLSDERVFTWVQRGLSCTLDARRIFERNMTRLLATISVPSQQDLARLNDRVEQLDRNLGQTIERLERVTQRLKQRERRVASSSERVL